MFSKFVQNRVSRVLLFVLLGTLFSPTMTVLAPTYSEVAQAGGTSPAEDLDTIATYLGSYLSELKNPSFYSYSLDGSSYYVNDGGGDMYDGGNWTQPWFISNTNNTGSNSTSTISGDLNYGQTTSTTVDTDFKYVSLGYSSSPDKRPLTLLGTRTTLGNPIGFQKHGNVGADGGGLYTSGFAYSNATLDNFTVYAFYRQTYSAGDPSVCDLYMLIGQSYWNSNFGTVNSYGYPSTDFNGGYLYASGANVKNLLAITTLLSKPSGAQVTVAEIQTVVQAYTKRIREAIGNGLNTVTFDSNTATSGTPSVSSVTQASAGASVTLATQNTLTRTGFTFSGWNTAADGSGSTLTPGNPYTPAGNITLYAQWNSTITYDSNTATSGTVPSATTAKSSAAVTTLATNTGSLAKTGYTFGGWNTAANGTGSPYAAGASNFPSPGNTTLYAQWNSVITYNGNGFTSGSVPANSSLYGTSGSLAANTGSLAKTVGGSTYTLGGWNANETGTGTSYALSGAYTPAGNRTLYAQWNSVITYNGNNTGGTGSVPSNTTISGVSGTLATNTGNLTMPSKVFAGWNTLANGTGSWYAEGAVYPNSGNITLYGQWVTALAITGSSTQNISQGSAFRSDTYTATYGLDTKTVTYSLSPANTGITLETSTVTGTTYAYIRVANTVTSGIYTDTLTATDRMGTSVTKVVTLTVSAPIRWSASNGTAINTTLGKSASLRLDVTNGFSGKVFTLTQVSGNSAGITLDTSTASSSYVTLNVSSAVLAGSYTESITATDSTGVKVYTTISITVNGAIAMTKNGTSIAANVTSILFNGSSQYAYFPASNKFQLGNTFTIEWWQYQTDNNNYSRIFSMNGGSFQVDYEASSFYFWDGGTYYNLGSLGTYKNKWTHMALVVNNLQAMAYRDGVALKSTATAVASVTATYAPATTPLCLASRCTGTTPTIGSTSEMFGGNLTNFSVAKRADYSGTNTAAANFTPSTSLLIDANTVVALTATNSSSVFTDAANNGTSLTYVGSPTGSSMSPGGSGYVTQEISTTEGVASSSITYASTGGTGTKSISLTSSTITTTQTSSTNQLIVSIAAGNTAVNSTTTRSVTETLTATDSAGALINVPLRLKVNPPISLAATTLLPSTSAGIATYDTVTVSYGTGAYTYQIQGSPVNAGITYSTPSTGVYLISVDKTVPQGTYYETLTVTDEVGAVASTTITLTVNPGLSLASATGSTSLITTAGRSTSLRLNALNGSGAKTFTLTQVTGSSAGITLDVSTAASGYSTLNIGTSVAAGSYVDSITVTDTAGGRYSLAINVTVNPSLTISYGGSTSGAITFTTTSGKSVTTNAFTGASGTSPRSFTLSGLNSGISLDTSTANIAYVVLGSSLAATSSSAAKTYYETLTVTDSVSATSLRAFNVVVNPAISLGATSNSLTTTAGVTITDTITASYGTGTKTFSVSVSPNVAGISFTNSNANIAVVTVAPTIGAGSYTITLTATDTVSATGQISIPLTINGGPSITGPTSISMTTGYAYNSNSYSVSNGTGSIRFTLSGTLSGSYISLETLTATTFRLKMTSGAPSGSGVAATYYETVTAIDSLGASSTYNVTLIVNPLVSLTGNQTINATFGVASTNVYQTSGGSAPFNILGSTICAPVITYDGSYTVLKFVGLGTCTWTVPIGVASLDALVIGGGGSGGSRHAGGGGAGGYNYTTGISVTEGSNKTVVVGAGGAAIVTPGSGTQGNTGGGSQFGTISVLGGGGGGQSTNNGLGLTGGSGGGSTYLAAGGSGTVGQGNGGGTGTWGDNEKNWSGGGGGGAGGAGANATNTGAVAGYTNKYTGDASAGAGGAGVLNSITGTSLCYAAGGGGAISDLSAGTAGAGGGCSSTIVGGAGTRGYSNATAGTDETGSGGGAAGFNGGSNATSGRGGNGVVILRFLTPASTSRSNITVYTDSYLSTGKIIVNVPDSITVGTYSEVITVKDNVGASNNYTITINVAKATPVLTLGIPGGGNSATYGSPVSLTANSSTAGKFNFQKSSSTISGCGTVATSSGTSSCAWTPSDTSTATINSVFTPDDTTNYNSATSSNLVLSVAQADTLTVTFTSQTVTYTETGTAVSRAYTLNGLASIDAVSSVATAITGTANDGSSVNITGSATYGSAGTSATTKAGTFSLSGTGITFSGTTKASYYKAIVYSPGTITVNRAGNSVSFNYGTLNTVTYRPTGTETATPTYKGNGVINYSTASTSNCSLNASTGAMTTLQAGSCVVSLGVAESANYLGDTTTATVVINKAPRTITLASSSSSLKYAETATVSTTIDFAPLDGLISYSNGSSTGCTFDSITNVLTAKSGTATCTLQGSIDEGTNYQSANSNTVTVVLSKASAPTVTLFAPDNIDYSPSATSGSMPVPSFSITGMKFDDTVTALSYMTVTYIAAGTYSYNSTTVPTGANTYTVVPSGLTLSTGAISNYQTPNYVSSTWTINKIAQDTLTVTTALQESITVPSDIQYSGGTTGGAVTMTVVPGGTASGCYFVGKNLRASSSGTCIIRLTMAGNQNYLDKNSDDVTLVIASFTTVVYFDAPSNTGITINTEVPITKDVDQCSTDCVPTITGVSSTRINSGDLLIITGTDFAGATEVIFNRSFVVTTFQIDSNTQITVMVPSGLPVGTGTGSVSVKNAGKISFRFSGLDVTG